jgi:hypothetical protein
VSFLSYLNSGTCQYRDLKPHYYAYMVPRYIRATHMSMLLYLRLTHYRLWLRHVLSLNGQFLIVGCLNMPINDIYHMELALLVFSMSSYGYLLMIFGMSLSCKLSN